MSSCLIFQSCGKWKLGFTNRNYCTGPFRLDNTHYFWWKRTEKAAWRVARHITTLCGAGSRWHARVSSVDIFHLFECLMHWISKICSELGQYEETKHFRLRGWLEKMRRLRREEKWARVNLGTEGKSGKIRSETLRYKEEAAVRSTLGHDPSQVSGKC